MAIKEIIIPNFSETLDLLANKKQDIKANAPSTVLDINGYDGPCLIFKGSQDCGTIYLENHTIYPPDGRFGPEYLFEMNVSFVYRTTCGDTFSCAPSEILENHGRTSFQTEYGDGKYCALVTMTVTDLQEPFEVYVNEYEYCVEMYCCQNNVNNLAINIADCMAEISCKIDSYKNIGRNFTKLTSRYLKMSNLLWVINNTVTNCDSYDSLACLFKKI